MKICDKNPFFLIMLNKVLTMISANAKANVKQQEKKIWCLYLKLLKKLPSKLEIQFKKGA